MSGNRPDNQESRRLPKFRRQFSDEELPEAKALRLAGKPPAPTNLPRTTSSTKIVMCPRVIMPSGKSSVIIPLVRFQLYSPEVVTEELKRAVFGPPTVTPPPKNHLFNNFVPATPPEFLKMKRPGTPALPSEN